MAVSAGDIITPVLSAPEIIVFFLAGVTLQADLGSLFSGFMFESSDFCLVSATLYVVLAWAVTRLTTLVLALPVCLYETRMRCFVEAIEFGFVASAACLAAYVLILIRSGAVARRIGL